MINAKKEEKQVTDLQYSVRVFRASCYTENSFAFDMEVNGIKIYGCWYKQGKSKTGNDYAFVDFPARKGKDGNYYNVVFFPISKELQQDIARQIESLLHG